MRLPLETKLWPPKLASQQQHGGADNYCQRDHLLPIHGGNITRILASATKSCLFFGGRVGAVCRKTSSEAAARYSRGDSLA
jgi:hypothetical protein